MYICAAMAMSTNCVPNYYNYHFMWTERQRHVSSLGALYETKECETSRVWAWETCTGFTIPA